MKRYNAGEVITAMVTPMDENLRIDFSQVEKLVEHLIQNGSDAVVVAGTTGESPTLTHDEELELLKVVKAKVKSMNSPLQIIMGAGSNSTVTAIEMSKKVEKAGADAILSVVPYYNKPSQSGMIAHFETIANSVGLPIMLYNIPSRTGVNMEPETILRLAKKHHNIFAVKQSNGNLDLVTEILQDAPDGFLLYSGDDSLTLPMLSLGATGVVSVASHLIGNQIKEMIQSFKNGNTSASCDLHHKYYPVFKKIFMAPNPVPIKAALEAKGLIKDYVRMPLVPLTELQKQELLSCIEFAL